MKKTLDELGQAAVIRNYINNCRNRNLVYSMPNEIMIKIFKSECYYCGQVPSNKMKICGQNQPYAYNGLDRIDNNRGYVPDNVVPCCKRCNKAKSNKTKEEFLNWVHDIKKRVFNDE